MGRDLRREATARSRAWAVGMAASAALGLVSLLATGRGALGEPTWAPAGVHTGAPVGAHDHGDGHAKLPPGPIRDRADIMAGVGKSAKAIGAALKARKPADVEKPALAIAGVMERFVSLFPEGSIGQGSRAKPAIWTDKTKFEGLARQLQAQATALAEAARSRGDVNTASATLWKTCKACHESFREPIDGE